jgi:hypothetical protein
MTRLPTITKDELIALYRKAELAGQVVTLAETQWPLLSTTQAINNIRKVQS